MIYACFLGKHALPELLQIGGGYYVAPLIKMKPIKISLWRGYKRIAEAKMNPEGRLNWVLDTLLLDGPVDRVTVEPDDPDARVSFTPHGSKYSSEDKQS